MLNVNLDDLKLITCHLGNGASVSAIKRGKCIDTSMGFTPLEGLVMGTRSGDIDPAIVTYIREKEHLAQGEANEILNKKSGVLGISGVSSDFRDLEAAAAEGNERALLAIKVFAHKVRLLQVCNCRPVADGAEIVGVVIALRCFSFRCRWLGG